MPHLEAFNGRQVFQSHPILQLPHANTSDDQIHTTDRTAAFGVDGSGKVNSNTRWNAVPGVLESLESFVGSILMVEATHASNLQ